MSGKQILDSLGLTTVCGTVTDFDGVYAGDLLSRAMSHVEAGNVWITIMSNMNVIAVASLTEAACVILAEGVTLVPEALEAAKEKDICVLSSEKTVYQLCAEIATQIG